MMRPPCTITVPNGKSARRASSIAIRMNCLSSSAAAKVVIGAATASVDVATEPARTDRRLTGTSPSGKPACGRILPSRPLSPQLPAEPAADRAAQHHLEVAPPQPRHLFGQHRTALPPRARHADRLAPHDAASPPERLDKRL